MPSNHFFGKDIVSIRDFSRDDLEFIFDSTDKVQQLKPEEKSELGKGRTLGYIFYEPSTRTRMSFEAAMASLGGGSSRYAAELSSNPIINAGSGSEEHPTQAMLDLYTIFKEKGRIDGLNIGIVGDLKYGRTVYSLLYGLKNYNVNVYLVSPPSLAIRKESIFEFEAIMNIIHYNYLVDVIPHLDVLYVTRIQKERFPDTQEYEKVKGTYRIDEKVLDIAKTDLSIMHPLPRLDEISHNIDNTKNAIYFKQAAYGKELRSALLALILNEDHFKF